MVSARLPGTRVSLVTLFMPSLVHTSPNSPKPTPNHKPNSKKVWRLFRRTARGTRGQSISRATPEASRRLARHQAPLGEIPKALPSLGRLRVEGTARQRPEIASLSPTCDLDSLRGSSIKLGTMQRRLAWPLRKDDTHKSRSVNFLCCFLCFVTLATCPGRRHSGRLFPPSGGSHLEKKSRSKAVTSGDLSPQPPSLTGAEKAGQ